jgi:hypothetical protein
LTVVDGKAVFAAVLSASISRAPMTKETAEFIVNGKPLVAEYEARTTQPAALT